MMCDWEDSQGQIVYKKTKDGMIQPYYYWKCSKGHTQLAGKGKKYKDEEEALSNV